MYEQSLWLLLCGPLRKITRNIQTANQEKYQIAIVCPHSGWKCLEPDIYKSSSLLPSELRNWDYIMLQSWTFVFFFSFVSMLVLVAQSCLTLCDSADCSLPGSSVHGILQARILEWVAIPFSHTLLSWLFAYQPCSLVSDHLDDSNLGLFTSVSNIPSTVPFTLSVFSMHSNELRRLGYLWSWSKSFILQMVKLGEEWTCSRLQSKFVVEQTFLPPDKPCYLAKMD